MPTTVGERGQVTIEKAIREQLGVYAGDLAVQRVEDGRVVIEFVPAPHTRSLAGSLRDVARPVADDTDWQAVKEYADQTPDPDRTA
jgi:AbrB family looped-hinge helix DNA binding protein